MPLVNMLTRSLILYIAIRAPLPAGERLWLRHIQSTLS